MYNYMPCRDFWIPNNKLGLLNYLTNQFPQDTKKFFSMPKKKLMAIYISVRRKRG